jgi:hypothetical protein
MASKSVQQLVEQARTLECGLGRSELDRIADLMLRIMQDSTLRAGCLLTETQSLTYAERSDAEREAMRSAVRHILFSLILLDIVDMPD